MRNIEESEWLASPSLGVIETKETELARISDFNLTANQASNQACVKTMSHKPNPQLAIMAGVIIARSSRRSITLNVSDWMDPVSLAV